jgi:hypothetical protein
MATTTQASRPIVVAQRAAGSPAAKRCAVKPTARVRWVPASRALALWASWSQERARW